MNKTQPQPEFSLAKDKIRVNCVNPGYIKTPMTDETMKTRYDDLMTKVPMNRLGTADECSGAFLYLASDALSSYVTGQIIEVNGGQYMP